MKTELVNLVMVISYIGVVIMFGLIMFWLSIQRVRNAEAMRKNIQAKLMLGIKLTSKDVVNIGKSYGLSAFQSRKVIYKVFRDADNAELFGIINSLINEIEIEEPYDGLPDEVKPSLVRLTKISKDSNEEGDKHILSPIINTLNKYVELKSEQEKLKKQTNKAYILTIISFVVGAVSFYFTLMSPSAKEIATEMQSIESQKTIISEKSRS